MELVALHYFTSFWTLIGPPTCICVPGTWAGNSMGTFTHEVGEFLKNKLTDDSAEIALLALAEYERESTSVRSFGLDVFTRTSRPKPGTDQSTVYRPSNTSSKIGR